MQDEIKEKIKNYFIDSEEDKFTKYKIIKSKPVGLAKGFFQIIHVSDKETSAIFFNFFLLGIDWGSSAPFNFLLVLDDDKRIALTETVDTAGAVDIASDTEWVRVCISMADMLAIAKANKIEYSLRYRLQTIEGVLDDADKNRIKGFYNNTFDGNFEKKCLYDFIESEKGGCYIATMVYGSYSHPQVLLLRCFRDKYLANKSWGIGFIEVYYKYAPRLAEKLKKYKFINKIIRCLLDSVIWLAK